MTITLRGLSTPQQPELLTRTHLVQFSEDEASLIDAVSTFIGAGLAAGEVCILITTPSHLQSLEQRLQAEGFDLALARDSGTFLSRDAAMTLECFLSDGEPDPIRLAEVIEPLIAEAGQGGRRVRIFGEMVALLWTQGKRTAAVRLEAMWNERLTRSSFLLFCAYPIQAMSGSMHEAQFTQICQQHSHIVLPESYTRLSEQERGQAFALLQQKAHSLEVEVAERKAAEQRLRVLASIVESSDDAILSKDLDGFITSWNNAAERIYGYSAQEMIGQHVTILYPHDRYKEYEQIMEYIRRGKRVEHYETMRRRRDGTELLASVTISPVKDEAGIICGASSIARDITKQRLLADQSQQLFASNLIGIFLADRAGTLQEVNQAFLDLVGYTQAEWQEEMERASFAASHLCPPVLQVSQKRSSNAPQEMIIPHKSGRAIPVLVAVTCISHSETCIGFVLDISERKELEQRKDTFIGMASHELKTPVTCLKGCLSLLQRLLANQDNEKVRRNLTRMDTQIEKLTKLINDLLDISRMQTGKLIYREEEIEVDALVQDIVESVQETTVTHQLQISGASRAVVFGDRDRLGQVLINLLTNAMKYSSDAHLVIVHLSTEGRQVLISVQDFGLGIAKEHHHKIFERFYQVTDPTEKTYPGLGIGLTISSEIVKRHQGRLWVESEHGQGASFHLSLPLLQREDHPTETAGEKG